MNPHLFVYGTLLSGARHPMGERLRRAARLVGDASIAGQLYRIGHYPGLAETAAKGAIVHGEVYVLGNPVSMLKWLDAYEGIRPGGPGDYERVERMVHLASGAALSAWVYLYRRRLGPRRPIPGGRWLAASDRP